MQPSRETLFEVLIREHEFGLTAFLRAAGLDAASADDLAQDCFIAAWRQIDTYDRNRPFSAWLRGIAQHKLIDHYRHTEATTRRLDAQQLDAVSAEFARLIPGRGDAINDTLVALEDCLAALPVEDHDIVRHAYTDGLSCAAIAGQIGRTIEAVKKRLQRARASLRDCILGKLATEIAHD